MLRKASTPLRNLAATLSSNWAGTRGFRCAAASVAGLVAVLLWSAPAWAHGSVADGKSPLGGALHFFTSPLALAAVVGLVATLLGLRERMNLAVNAVAGIAAAASAVLATHVPAFAAPAAVVVVGLSAVAGWKPSNAGALLLAAMGGMAAGVASDLDAPSLQGAIGVAGALVLILGLSLATYHDLSRFPRLMAILPIARRVVGSWVAAIGLLMAALAIHMSKG